MKRARKVATTGGWLLCLVVVGASGILHAPPPDKFSVESARTLLPGHVVAVLLTRWEFVHSLPEADAWLQRAALKQSRDSQQVYGFLRYAVASFAKLVEPIEHASLEQSVHDIQFNVSNGDSSEYEDVPRSYSLATLN